MLTARRLAAGFHRAERLNRLTAFALTCPLLAFLLTSFVIPIGSILVASVENPPIKLILPRFALEIARWEGEGLPPASTVDTFIADLAIAETIGSASRLVGHLNHHIAGFRSLMKTTAAALIEKRALAGSTVPRSDGLSVLRRIDPRWGEPRYWAAIKQATPTYTSVYLLRAIDRKLDENGNIVRVPEHQAVYVMVFWRTVWLSTTVTLLCLLLGFPIAYLLAILPTSKSNFLLLLLLLPIWTSVLVRSSAWLVLLQNEGVVNDLGRGIGLWDEPIQLVRNRFGTYVTLVQVFLPYMALPIYSAMKRIDPFHMKAAATCGATPLRAFIRVYLPQAMPGVGAGVALVYILALGTYIPPALVGGPADQTLNYFIVNYANAGLGAALSILLIGLVAISVIILLRFVRIDAMRRGWY